MTVDAQDDVIVDEDGTSRCWWPGTHEGYVAYHDTEWGKSVHDDVRLFEKLCLEGFQSGLSWLTILRKRPRFREVFDGFDPAVVARYGEDDIAGLLGDPGIIRHRGKIAATIGNAQAWQRIEAAQGFDRFLWDYVGGAPLQNRWATLAEVPAFTPLSEQISKDLKKAGFRFCGPTIVYAFMQAVGMVNDHVVTCPRHADLAQPG